MPEESGGGTETEPVLSREQRIERFGEEHVEHTEWWVQESNRVESFIGDVLEVIEDRDDARVTRRGTSTDKSGEHEARLRIAVAGDPWEGHDGDEQSGERTESSETADSDHDK